MAEDNLSHSSVQRFFVNTYEMKPNDKSQLMYIGLCGRCKSFEFAL